MGVEVILLEGWDTKEVLNESYSLQGRMVFGEACVLIACQGDRNGGI